VNYPLIGDADLTVAKLYDMIHPNATGGKRTAVENATVRSVFVIGPDKKVKAMIAYPMSTGRNFARSAAAARFGAAHGEAHGGDAGQLEAWPGRDHPDVRLGTTTRVRNTRRASRPTSPICVPCNSRSRGGMHR